MPTSPTEPTVAVAGPHDHARVAALRRAWTEERAGGPVGDGGFEDRLARWYGAQQRITWLASVAGRDVGMLNLAVFERMPRPGEETGRWGYVGNAFVLAAHRNAGIGALLLDTAVDYARSAGFARIVLSPAERSVPFYQRAGFRPANTLLMLSLDGEG